MNIKPRGLYGSMQRVRDIQARIDALTPQRRHQNTNVNNEVTPNPTPSNGFKKEILDTGFRPFDPTGAGVSLSIQRAPADLLPIIQQAAAKAGIDPALLEALVGHESSFRRDAVSISGAQGLAQLMPKTAQSLGVTNPFDPTQNLNAGARYLAQMLRQFNGDRELALAAYSSGPATVNQVGGIPDESMGYVQDIIKRAGEISGSLP